MDSMNLEETWKATVGELEIVVSKASFSTWFKEIFPYSKNEDSITLAVPSDFHLNWIKDKHQREILKILQKYYPQVKELKYKIASRKQAVLPFTPLPAKPAISLVPENCQPYYTFETFVVGNNNRLAYTVSQAVAKAPGKTHNPLFIYGGVGLGKTHLMQAIGNEIAKNARQKKKILYVSCEKFTNEFIESIFSKTIDAFKKKYRSIDVFLVDDIQFLAKKEGTQEEFFHTFNTLHQSERQVVLTSDRPPNALADLEQRLTSRFGGGMVVDIKPANLETRLAILGKKCVEKNYTLPNEVKIFIAETIQSNIRDLEGCLHKVVTTCEVENYPFTVESAKKILEDFIISQNKKITPQRLIKIISEFFQVTEQKLLSSSRLKELVIPRQIIMYLLQTELSLPYTKIAKILGGKDHSTIIYGCGKIQREINRDLNLQNNLILIKEKLYRG